MHSRPVQVAPRKALALEARGEFRCSRLKAVAGTCSFVMGAQLFRRDTRGEPTERDARGGY